MTSSITPEIPGTTSSSGVFGTDLALAFPAHGPEDREAKLRLLRRLHRHYVSYMAGPEAFLAIPRLNTDTEILGIEEAWLSWEDRRAGQQPLPESGAEFHEWFLNTADAHTQPEFCAYLAESATLDEIALFFLAEELVDSKFDDLMAMVQIGTADATKLTIAENYWDEMGEGDLSRMHTRMFEHSAVYMREHLAKQGIDSAQLHVAEVYANAALLLMYGIHRHLNPRALGAMGVLEQSASPRFQAMVDGCTRLGIPSDVIDYQRVHVHVDADHGAEWFKGVFLPLVDSSPQLLREIALGVVTRVRVADAYYREIWNQMRDLRRS